MKAYSGTDNLKVMTSAVNYNNYLANLVLSHANSHDFILDFGAGIGLFAKRVFDEGYRVNCVEPDSSQAAIIAKEGLSVVMDLSQIPDDSVDYLYTLNVLEHIADDYKIVCSLYRKLKRGGRLLIYVPAFNILYSSMDRKVGHLRRYTKKDLAEMAVRAGFTLLHARYADSAGFLITLLFKLVRNNSGKLNVGALIIYDRIVFPLSRIMDRLLGSLFGKNVILICKK